MRGKKTQKLLQSFKVKRQLLYLCAYWFKFWISDHYLRHFHLIGCMRTCDLIGNNSDTLLSHLWETWERCESEISRDAETRSPYLVYCWASVVCRRSVSMVIFGLFRAEIFWILLIRVWINRILPMLWLHCFLKKLYVFVYCLPSPSSILSASFSPSLLFLSHYYEDFASPCSQMCLSAFSLKTHT